MMRLDKYLAERTGMTRSESRKAVTKGRVSIDGAVCRKADTQLDEHTAAVALDGVPLAGATRRWSIWSRRTFRGGNCSPRGGWTRRAPALCC